MVAMTALLLSTCVGVVIALSVTLNLLVLYVFLRCYAKLEFIHHMLMSIAISDILMSVIGFLPEIISTNDTGYLNEDHAMCLASGFVIFALAISIIFHVSTFYVIRTIAIIYPVQFRWWFNSKSRSCLILIACHLCAIAWASFPLLSWSKYKLDLDKRRCSLDWKLLHPSSLSYIISVLVCCYFVPAVVIICAIVRGETVLRKRKSAAVKRSPSSSVKNLTKILENQYLKQFKILAVMFFIAWTPYALTGILAVSHRAPPATIVTLSALFAKMASVSNPVTNCFINKQFRKKLLRISAINTTWKWLSCCFNHNSAAIEGDSYSVYKQPTQADNHLFANLNNSIKLASHEQEAGAGISYLGYINNVAQASMVSLTSYKQQAV